MHYLDLPRAGVALLALGLILISPDQAGAQQQEWTSYGSDLASSKYVPLQQINADNVGDLEIAWMWETPDNELFRSRADVSAAEYKSTPLMVNGALYVSTSLGQVGAVDALTGEELWTFDTGSW